MEKTPLKDRSHDGLKKGNLKKEGRFGKGSRLRSYTRMGSGYIKKIQISEIEKRRTKEFEEKEII